MKRVKNAILGVGVSGQALLAYLHERGEEVLLFDKNCDTQKQIFPDQIDYWQQVDRLFVSPGVSEDHPLILKAAQEGVLITSEIEIALELLQSEKIKLFAVTGTCGKTTTTSLTTHILTSAGFDAKSYGNIGYPLIHCVKEKPAIAVVELSSFQLGYLPKKPYFDGALILNISPNHLDYHGTMQKYVEAKSSVGEMLKEGAPFYLSEKTYEQWGHLFSLRQNIFFFDKEKVASISLLRYRDGRFGEFAGDQQNSQAAFSLCKAAGMSQESFESHLETFKKPEHRFEFVRVLNDVIYINDSKATTIVAVVEAMNAVKGKVILIAGGVDKECDFTPWKSAFAADRTHLMAFGRAASKIKEVCSPKLSVEVMKTLEEAVAAAHKRAKAGDSVVLSPGCASFDQFKNYEHRGKRFKELVLEL